MDLTYPPAQLPEIDGTSRRNPSLHELFLVYRQQFWRWFAITAPTSLLASIVLVGADQRIRAIHSTIPRAELQFHWTDIALAGSIRLGGFFISWLLGAFALGAIAAAVSNGDSSDDEIWRHDSHQRAREHFGQLFLAALFTFVAFLLGGSGCIHLFCID